jgi:general secretion pathway protein C
VAAELALIGQRLASRANAIPIQTMQRVVYGALVLWLLYAIVQMIGLLIPGSQAPDQQVVAAPLGQVAAKSSQIDIKRLQSFNLFGQLGEQPIVVDTTPLEDDIEDTAVKTKLSLVLQGIVSASDSASAVAIIVHKGKQEQYHIGEKLPVGNRVILAKVLLDHVILDNKGKYESLWLYDEANSTFNGQQTARNTPRAKPRPPQNKITDMRKNQEATTLAKDYRKRLYKNPKSLAEVLRIAPAQQDGQMVGYRVSPGKDRQQFTNLGFKANDIVTSINDIALDEPSQALEVYKLMRTATEASFTVLRNGESVQLMVTLGANDE